MNKLRVMIVEDSGVIRQFLEHIIDSDPRLNVVSCVESGEDAVHALSRTPVDVISMDIHLPGMNGLETTRRIMEDQPTPIVVVSGCLRSDDLTHSLNALRAGALAVVEKPVGTTHADYKMLAERLCTQLAIMSQVRVVRQRFNRQRRVRAGEGKDRTADGNGAACQSAGRRARMIGIVSSTGGPRALQSILSRLPADFPIPISVVQHVTVGFHEGFVNWLDSACELTVKVPRHGELARGGYVYMAPADYHLRVDRERLKWSHAEPVCAQRPSGTVLLQSMAETLRQHAIGIVLTGMGSDGADGLLSIRDAGGYTIAESESTAVVYGMPAVASQIGAVCDDLPLHDIAPRLLELVGQSVEVCR